MTQKPGSKATHFQPGNKAAVGHGAPLGNTNAFKHGLKAERAFATGLLPAKCRWIVNRVTLLRKRLESAVYARYGELTLKAALLIQSACRHEQAALLAQRAMRVDGDRMSMSERLSYLTSVGNESDKRDKAMEKLNLDPAETGSILDELYGPRGADIPADDAESGEGGSHG